MYCYIHEKVKAVGSCVNCGKLVCKDCAVELRGKIACRECLASGQFSRSSEKDPNTAFIIELIAGLFGFLGIGYIYVGRHNEGILRLILWLAYLVIVGIVVPFIIGLTMGAACVCIPFLLVIQIGVPFWSATKLKNDMLVKEQG